MAEWGDKVEFLEDVEDSGITPKALLNRPIIHEWMKEYLDAFRLLSGTRQVGMAPCPISLSEMLAYLQLYGASDTEAFIEYMVQMDASFLSVTTERMKREQANGTGSSP